MQASTELCKRSIPGRCQTGAKHSKKLANWSEAFQDAVKLERSIPRRCQTEAKKPVIRNCVASIMLAKSASPYNQDLSKGDHDSGEDEFDERSTHADPDDRGLEDPFFRERRGDPFLRFGRGDPFLRFGRGDPFLRFGRGDPFLRFGRGDPFLRFGRGDPFLRFGRGDPFLRFGRGDPFLRFGRDDQLQRKTRGDPFLRFGRGDPFLRFGRGDPFLRFGRGDPFLRFGRGDPFLRFGRGDPFLRFGRGDPFLRFGRDNSEARVARGDPFLRFGRFKVSADPENSPLELDDEDISRRASDDKSSRRKREASPVEMTSTKRFLDSASAASKEKTSDKRSNVEVEEARQTRNGPYMRFGRNNMVYDLLDDNKENLLDDEYTRQTREPSRIAYPRYGKRSE